MKVTSNSSKTFWHPRLITQIHIFLFSYFALYYSRFLKKSCAHKIHRNKILFIADDSHRTKTDAPIPRFSTPATTPTLNRPKETTTATIPHTSRSTEASALSAFLIPGGQVPSSSGSAVNIRPLGRSTITKVASPHFDRNLGEQSRERQKFIADATLRNTEVVDDTTFGQNQAFVVDEEARVTDDGPFNWYFQHYNDTNLEPYVGVVYNGVMKIDACQWLFLLALSVLI